jgi:hypothetical protein
MFISNISWSSLDVPDASSEKVDIVVLRLPWAACKKVLEHGAAEKPRNQALEVELRQEKG